MRTVGRRSILGLGVLTALPVAMVGGMGTPAGGAGAFNGVFSASAAADAFRLAVTVPNAPLSEAVLDGGGPSSQAVLDSLGTSRAFASFPFPGENVATASGLGRSVTGAPVPDYPFYVASSNPTTPKQEYATGPVALRATSSESGSAGRGEFGGARPDANTAIASATSESSVSQGDSVAAKASSAVSGLAVGPLTIAQVVSGATTTLSPSGELTRTATTHVVGAAVNGTPIMLTPEGVDSSAVAGPLAGAGISVEFLRSEDLPAGVVAPAVRISQRRADGGTTILTIGGASAFVEGAGETTTTVADSTDAASESPGAEEPALLAPPARLEPATSPVSSPYGPVAGSLLPPDPAQWGSEPLIDNRLGRPVVAPETSPSGATTGTVPVPSARPAREPSELATPAGDPARVRQVAGLLVSSSDARPVFLLLAATVLVSLAIAPALLRKRTEGSSR